MSRGSPDSKSMRGQGQRSRHQVKLDRDAYRFLLEEGGLSDETSDSNASALSSLNEECHSHFGVTWRTRLRLGRQFRDPTGRIDSMLFVQLRFLFWRLPVPPGPWGEPKLRQLRRGSTQDESQTTPKKKRTLARRGTDEKVISRTYVTLGGHQQNCYIMQQPSNKFRCPS